MTDAILWFPRKVWRACRCFLGYHRLTWAIEGMGEYFPAHEPGLYFKPLISRSRRYCRDCHKTFKVVDHLKER